MKSRTFCLLDWTSYVTDVRKTSLLTIWETLRRKCARHLMYDYVKIHWPLWKIAQHTHDKNVQRQQKMHNANKTENQDSSTLKTQRTQSFRLPDTDQDLTAWVTTAVTTHPNFRNLHPCEHPLVLIRDPRSQRQVLKRPCTVMRKVVDK